MQETLYLSLFLSIKRGSLARSWLTAEFVRTVSDMTTWYFGAVGGQQTLSAHHDTRFLISSPHLNLLRTKAKQISHVELFEELLSCPIMSYNTATLKLLHYKKISKSLLKLHHSLTLLHNSITYTYTDHVSINTAGECKHVPHKLVLISLSVRSHLRKPESKISFFDLVDPVKLQIFYCTI